MLPKLVFTDIDGVWTDGGMYYDQSGNEWKKFNTKDSGGILMLKVLKIPVVVLTGEDTEIVKRRCEKLKIDYLFQGVKNKIETAKKLCDDLGISLADAAYIGDDIIDIKLLNAVGFSAAPSNAQSYIKEQVDYTTVLSGGDGAFREFVEAILNRENLLKEVLIKLSS